MEHERLKQALSELRDGELEPAARLEILAHLEGCAPCAAAFRRMARLGALLQAPAAAAQDRTEAFLRRLQAAEAPMLPAWLPPRWLFPALGTGVACLFLAIAQGPAQPSLDELVAGPASVSSEELDLLRAEER